MVDVHFDDSDGSITCEGCGSELPAFLDECPYCTGDDEGVQEETEAPCPSCGAMIYDDSERCAICGAYVSMGLGGKGRGSSTWIVIVVLVLVALILFSTIGRS